MKKKTELIFFFRSCNLREVLSNINMLAIDDRMFEVEYKMNGSRRRATRNFSEYIIFLAI